MKKKIQFDDILLCTLCVANSIMTGITMNTKIWPIIILLILLDILIVASAFRAMFYKGVLHGANDAIDTTTRMLERLKKELERGCKKPRYKAIFWTFWGKINDRAWRNDCYNRACKEAKIDQHWCSNEAPNVAEKDDIFDLYPFDKKPVECIKDARLIEAESLEQFNKLRDRLCDEKNGVIHCCVDIQPLEEMKDGQQ